MSDKPSCSFCAYRETCNKKFSIIDPSKCMDYARDLRIQIPNEDEENTKDDKKK